MISKWARKGVLFLACLFVGLGMPAYAQSVSAPTQIVVVDDTQFNLLSSFGGTVSISGFDPAGVRVTVPQGNLRITTTSGLTAPPSASSADWAGASSIYFEGTLADVNAALASLEIQGSGQTVSVTAHAGYIYGTDTGNSYQVVTNPLKWSSAEADAQSRTLNGVPGHLATITSQTELDAILANVSWSNHVWLGGSDSAAEGEWFWVTGPEAGTQFYSDNDPSLTTFASFRSDQPSNSIGGQHHLTMMENGTMFDQVETRLFAYMIEYPTTFDESGSFFVTTQAIIDAAAAAAAALAAQQAAIANAESDLKLGLDNHLRQKLASHMKEAQKSQSNQFVMHRTWEDKQGQAVAFLKPKFYLHIKDNREDNRDYLDAEAKIRLALQKDEGHVWTMSGQASTATLKNGGALSHFSTRFIYDRDLEKDIAHRLYLGFETSKERGGYDFSLRTRTNSISSGYGLSQRLSETLYFNLHLASWYSTIQTKYDRNTTSAEASLKMLGASASAQLQGQYQISDMVWLELMAGFSKAKDIIQHKMIKLNVPLTQSLSHILISEPESTRRTFEPTLRFLLMPDENKLLRELKLTPRFSCEKMSSTKPVDVCAEGLRAEYQIKTPDDGKKGYLYFDYENLANGPVHEYGLAMDMRF